MIFAAAYRLLDGVDNDAVRWLVISPAGVQTLVILERTSSPNPHELAESLRAVAAGIDRAAEASSPMLVHGIARSRT